MAKPKASRSRSPVSFGCASLFALPFAAVGLFMAWEVVRTFVEYGTMLGWVETPAQIVRADLEVEHDEGATYRAIAEYDYQYAGQNYHGSRVSLYSGRDNIGDFQRRVHSELKAHQSSGQPFRCFVNPSRPGDSILYRDLRWEMIAFFDLFLLMFGGFGGGVLIGAWFGSRESRKRLALEEEHPNKPWLWRPDWAANEIECSDKHWLPILVGAVLFWNIATLPLWWLLPPQILKQDYAALLCAVLPAIGVGLAISAVKRFLKQRKYGRCVFQMTNPPGAIGGELEGAITISRPLDGGEFKLVLRCQSKISDGEDSKTTVLWSDEQIVSNESSSSWGTETTVIPVRFEIPQECRPTGEQGKESISWFLTATCSDFGAQPKFEFLVPVFTGVSR